MPRQCLFEKRIFLLSLCKRYASKICKAFIIILWLHWLRYFEQQFSRDLGPAWHYQDLLGQCPRPSITFECKQLCDCKSGYFSFTGGAMKWSQTQPSGSVWRTGGAPEFIGNWWKISINYFLRRVLFPVDILHSTEEICIRSIQLFLISLLVSRFLIRKEEWALLGTETGRFWCYLAEKCRIVCDLCVREYFWGCLGDGCCWRVHTGGCCLVSLIVGVFQC